MGPGCFRHPGRRQHLELSLPSLLPEEGEAFPVSVRSSADRSLDWHCDQHALACHTGDKAQAQRLVYSHWPVLLHGTESRAHDSEHIRGLYGEGFTLLVMIPSFHALYLA
jgi:hypothetical protein